MNSDMFSPNIYINQADVASPRFRRYLDVQSDRMKHRMNIDFRKSGAVKANSTMGIKILQGHVVYSL